MELEHIYQAWDEALGAKDLDAAMALYHEDATLESPLVCRLLGVEDGVVHGKQNLRAFVAKVFAGQSPLRRRHRLALLTDATGATLSWEYPRQTPGADQLDIVEVMQLRDGLIARHRVYWGWFSVRSSLAGVH